MKIDETQIKEIVTFIEEDELNHANDCQIIGLFQSTHELGCRDEVGLSGEHKLLHGLISAYRYGYLKAIKEKSGRN